MSKCSTPSKRSQELTIEQRNAIDLLVQGLSDREVAEKVGVARETVTRWRNENPYFQAELNRKRKEIWGAAEDRLRALVSDAVKVLEEELKKGSLKAAIEVLKAVGLYGGVSRPSGATDPEVLMVEQARKWAMTKWAKRPPSECSWIDDSLMESAIAKWTRERLEELKQEDSHG